MEDLVLSCLESRVEENRNLYARFLVGPFLKGDALTVATALRRVLLSSRESIGITALYIQGITHEFSTIAGVRESVLELSLNFGAIVLSYDKTFFEKKTFFDEIQIGYLQVQGPKVVYANDLKLPLGVKLVDPTQYIATISKEGSIVLKFVIGKRNDLLNQKTSFYNSESDFGKQSIYFPALGELVKKNITRAKKRYPYKGCSFDLASKAKLCKPSLGVEPFLTSTKRSFVKSPLHRKYIGQAIQNSAFYVSPKFVKTSVKGFSGFVGAKVSLTPKGSSFFTPTVQSPAKPLQLRVKLRYVKTEDLHALTFYLAYKQKQIEANRSDSRQIIPKSCTGTNLPINLRFFSKHNLRSFVQTKHSKGKRFNINTTSFACHENQKLIKRFKFVTEKKHFFERAKLTKLYNVYRSLERRIRKGGDKNVQNQTLASKKKNLTISLTPKKLTFYAPTMQPPFVSFTFANRKFARVANLRFACSETWPHTKLRFVRGLESNYKSLICMNLLFFATQKQRRCSKQAKLYKASFSSCKGNSEFREKQTPQNRFGVMQIETSQKKFLTSLHNLMQTKSSISTVCTPIKQPFLNPFNATINARPLSNEKGFKSNISLRNVIPLDLTLTPVLKVNFVIEIDDEVLYLRQKIRERIVIEVWTNGSIHPRQAVHDAALSLTDMFGSFRSVYQAKSYSFPVCNSVYSLQSSYKYKGAHTKRSFVNKKFCKALVPRKNKWLRYQELSSYRRTYQLLSSKRPTLYASTLVSNTCKPKVCTCSKPAKPTKLSEYMKSDLRKNKIEKSNKILNTNLMGTPKKLTFALRSKGVSFAPYVNKQSLLSFEQQKQLCFSKTKSSKATKSAQPYKNKAKVVPIFDQKIFTKQIGQESKSIANIDKESNFFHFLSKKKKNNNFIYQSNLERNSLFFSDLGELSLPENLYCFLKKKGIENLSTLKTFSSFDLLLLVNGNRKMFCTLKRFLLKYNFPVANP